MTPPTLPYSQVHGELAYCPTSFDGSCETTPLEPELPVVIDASLLNDAVAASAYGPLLHPASNVTTQEYGLRIGIGHWYLDEARKSAYGPMLRGIIPIGCDTDLGIIRQGDFEGVIDTGTRIAESARLEPHLQAPGSAYGQTVVLSGFGRCYSIKSIPPPGFPPVWRKDLYVTDVFGLTCVFCPAAFATFERPCFGCSYDRHDRVVLGTAVDRVCPGSPPHDPNYYDGCIGQLVSVGDAVCVPWVPPGDPDHDPNWRIACSLTASVPDEHHCEDCVFQRNLGFLVNQILSATDALQRIPMKPSYSSEIDPSGLAGCFYECGAFGWTLWATSKDGLRIPDFLPTYSSLQIKEAPCSNAFCFGDDGWYESGYNFCGSDLDCDCTGNGEWRTGTHFFRWRKEDEKNLLTQCTVCFKQRELCDLANGQCDSNPHGDPDDYHNPSSEIIVDVEVHVKITLVFNHWGPLPAGIGGCGVCLGDNPNLPPAIIQVNIRGDFCGPMVWGNRDTFPGYMPEGGRIYPGRQNPFTGGQTESPAGTYPRGSCANFFSDQGLYGDDPFIEPPKRCPSWEGDESGDAPTQFWCPPRLRWTWDYTGGGSRWTPRTADPNKHQTGNECWSAQLVKNLGGCSDGSIMFDLNDVRPCDDPNCRRGCSLDESRDALDLLNDPCDPFTPRATPWGCGQCKV